MNPQTRDYELDEKGSPKIDMGLQTPAYFRLMAPRTKWMYAPDSKWGSDLRLIKKQSPGSAIAVENTMSRALQPLIDQRRALEVNITDPVSVRGGAGANIEIVSSTGEPETFNFLPVGGLDDN